MERQTSCNINAPAPSTAYRSWTVGRPWWAAHRVPPGHAWETLPANLSASEQNDTGITAQQSAVCADNSEKMRLDCVNRLAFSVYFITKKCTQTTMQTVHANTRTIHMFMTTVSTLNGARHHVIELRLSCGRVRLSWPEEGRAPRALVGSHPIDRVRNRADVNGMYPISMNKIHESIYTYT